MRKTMAATSTSRTTRYAPWLQRALRIKDETRQYWTQQQPTVSTESKEKERRPSAGPAPQTVWEAVEADNVAAATRLLETMPALVFQRRETSKDGGISLLHEAAFHGSHQVIQLVLHHVETHFPGETLRLFVNSCDTVHSQTTPLIAACRGIKGDAKNRLEIVQLLVQTGADVEHQDAHGDNVIHWCARTSSNVLLRWILRATDAGAHAVFAENHKRETPLDIAKRQLARATSQRFLAQNVLTTLRSVDRKCNVRLKMQVIKRQLTTLESERALAAETQWATALASAQDAIESSERLWKETLSRAEANRRDAETVEVTKAVDAARIEATKWLESKNGKAHLKKHLGIATEELKLEVLRGTLSKPGDIKRAANQRVSETYISQQTAAARKAASDNWRTTRTPLPSDPDKLVQLLERL